MTFRALAQRAFPYLVVAGVGFGFGYVVVLLFILPIPISGASLKSIGHRDTSASARVAPSTAASTTAVAPSDSLGAGSGETTATPESSGIPVVIPDLVGMSLDDAKPVLDGLQLQVVVQHDTSSLQPENTVLREDPVSGTQVAAGSLITIVVSRLPPIKGVPDSLAPTPDSATSPSASAFDSITS